MTEALLNRLQSVKVLLGTDSPEVRGWAPVVQQGAQATVNAAIAELKRLDGAVAAERERYAPLMQAVEWLLDDGHMNQEHLARLRAAWEAV